MDKKMERGLLWSARVVRLFIGISLPLGLIAFAGGGTTGGRSWAGSFAASGPSSTSRVSHRDLAAPGGPGTQKLTFDEADFRDRVFACWLGKNIGGTLGMPFEGKRETQAVTFFTDLKPGEPAANDDLDLQILWLKAMEENGGRVDARILGEYWLRYVPVDWNEYGVGKANMREGWLPPLSGEYNNAQWKHSNGAWIRSEIWACLAPGMPALAARMAREDACVDHGAAEGTLAEIFTATLESAAFVERDRDKLIAFGLSMIPQDCRVAKAVRTAIASKAAGKDWRGARADVVAATEDTGWFQAPRNVAFMIIGWLYGDGDFGRSICTAVNCGDDTDCTPATLGSILGIIGGTKAIPALWREPIGDKIKTVAVAGFPIPENLGALTDRTVAMAKKVLALNGAPVEIAAARGTAPSEPGPEPKAKAGSRSGQAGAGFDLAAGRDEVRALWSLSPYRITWREADLEVVLDYVSDPVITVGVPRVVGVSISNPTSSTIAVRVELLRLPEGWRVTGMPAEPMTVKPGAVWRSDLRFEARALSSGPFRMMLRVSYDAKEIRLPLTFAGGTK